MVMLLMFAVTSSVMDVFDGSSSSELVSNGAASEHVALKGAAVAVLLLLSAAFSGPGLGLMSLDLIGLEIVAATGADAHATERERRHAAAARRVLPLREQGNLLLTTLLLGNVSVNSLTSILMADLTSGRR